MTPKSRRSGNKDVYRIEMPSRPDVVGTWPAKLTEEAEKFKSQFPRIGLSIGHEGALHASLGLMRLAGSCLGGSITFSASSYWGCIVGMKVPLTNANAPPEHLESYRSILEVADVFVPLLKQLL